MAKESCGLRAFLNTTVPQPRRSEIGVVAKTDAGSQSGCQEREVGQQVGIGAAGVDKGHGAERFAEMKQPRAA